MGQERDCKLRLDGRTQAGKAYLETDYILVRGGERLKIRLQDVTSVAASAGALHLEFSGRSAVLELGDAAAKWAQKILHPPSRLDKLGVKPGTKVCLVGAFAADFTSEFAHADVALVSSSADLVFFAAAATADLRRIPKLAVSLTASAALWVVYPKGVSAIREIEVIEAGRSAGLKDTKVARFSDTHTALRFSK